MTAHDKMRPSLNRLEAVRNMGYTHYWTLARPITGEECGALAEDVRKIVAASGVPVEVDRLDEREISLNGVGDDGHETFYIKAEKSGITNEPGMAGFAFCKTAHKPYDVIVTASLLALKDRLKADVKVSSDGDPADWADGHRLALVALGRIMPSPSWALDA